MTKARGTRNLALALQGREPMKTCKHYYVVCSGNQTFLPAHDSTWSHFCGCRVEPSSRTTWALLVTSKFMVIGV